jgi:hypothetical protein
MPYEMFVRRGVGFNKIDGSLIRTLHKGSVTFKQQEQNIQLIINLIKHADRHNLHMRFVQGTPTIHTNSHMCKFRLLQVVSFCPDLSRYGEYRLLLQTNILR